MHLMIGCLFNLCLKNVSSVVILSICDLCTTVSPVPSPMPDIQNEL